MFAVANFVTVGDVTLHYRLDGQRDGTPLLFLNSLGSDLRIWDGVIAPLADSFPLIRYDQRGHGLSDAPPGPYTLRDQTNDLLGLLAHLQQELQTERIIPIGVSVGGLIALDFALRCPDRVAALVLYDTGAKIGTTDYWEERITAIRTDGIEPLADKILLRWFSQAFPARQPAAYRGYRNMLTRTSAQGYIATCAALRDADLRAAVAAIQVPALVLCGDEDLATPPALGRELAAALPNGRFTLIEQAGHIPSIEQPAGVAATIKHFLEEILHG